MSTDPAAPTRREALGLALALSLAPRARADDGRLLVRNGRPLDAETPIEALDRDLTPNPLMFVRSHFGVPAAAPGPWRVDLGGEVERPRAFTLDDLAGLDRVTQTAVIQCSGNGRAYFRPRLPGVLWERGAVGQAEWTGVRLADVLARAGVKPGAGHVHLLGADGPPSPKTPAFLRSIPLDRALAEDTLLATTMNGEPLPPLHGGPLRLVVPGWAANHWIKWLRVITVARDEAPGFFMQTAYRYPKAPAPPGQVPKPEDYGPLTTLNVKSLVAWPPPGATLAAGRHRPRGVAWTGEGTVSSVEFSADGGSSWEPAALDGPPRPGAWRLWHADWEASRPGRYTLCARATDSRGNVQPEVGAWNRSGYLWNGIDRVPCEVH